MGNNYAFAARRSDGRVVAWGEGLCGPGPVSVQLTSVVQVEATEAAFAALRADGQVVCWGTIQDVDQEVFEVKKLVASSKAFAALRADGRVVSWGLRTSGGDSSRVQERLMEVQKIFAARNSFVAERRDGKAVIWGEFELEEDDPILESITDIQDGLGGA